MSDMPTIEKNVPIQTGYSNLGPSKTEFVRSMEVGDSFFLRGEEKTEVAVIRSWRQAFRHVGVKASFRVVEGGVRVWRTA